MAKVELSEIVAATNTGGFVYATEKEVAKLLKDGMVEQNPAMTDGNKIATRATQKGIDSMNTTATAAGTATATAPAFEIEVGPALDRPKRGNAGKPDKYPFDQMPAPDANGNTARIFVAATEKMPEPWKSLSSTVSAASRRYSRVVGTKPGKNNKGEEITKNIYEFDRKFAVVEGDRNGQKGAYIERIK